MATVETKWQTGENSHLEPAMKVTIEKLIYGGWGLGRYEEKVVLVPGVMPSEVVEIEVQRELKDYIIANPLRILKASPQRIEPKCPHFLQCGGCDYQHIPYELQLLYKEEIFKEELKRIGRIDEEVVRPIVPSPLSFGWRIKLDLAVEMKERLYIGFYRRNTKEVVPISTCPVAHPLAEGLMLFFKEVLQRHLVLAPFIRHLEIFVSPDEGKGFLIIYSLIHHKEDHMRKMAAELMNECPNLKDVLLKTKALVFPHSLTGLGRTQSALKFFYEGMEFLLYPGVFVQANLDQNKNLISLLREKLKDESGETLELYAGMGNLSLPLARFFSLWTAVEKNRLAVKNGNYNAQKNGIKLTFINEEAIRVLENWSKEGKKCDLLLLDPPRQGALEELKQALSLNPKRIVYISCNPSTLARDLRFLIDNGYTLEETIPLDFFPQTFHIESVSFLKRS